MKIQTVFICPSCNTRIEYDTEIECYLEHKHLKNKKEDVAGNQEK